MSSTSERQDRALRDALDQGLARLIAAGELRRLYERYGIWTEAQDELPAFPGPIEPVTGDARDSRLAVAGPVSIAAAGRGDGDHRPVGHLDAPGHDAGAVHRDRPALWARTAADDPFRLRRADPGHAADAPALRAFYLLRLPPWVAGIAGLAINYSAYEAEIYRAGLQAIPAGQMEAALALGMSRWMALRRVIVPQAVRIVIPPVTNDFIALFKDTSVCSVITLVELTKEYSILANSTGGAIEFALAAAFLYMLMSVPLSWFSRWSERNWARRGAKGGVWA